MGAFAAVVQTMADMNIFHLFFPWLLIFAVSYGVMNKNEVFSEDQTVNGVIALSIAFLTIGGAAVFVPEGLYTHFAAALSFGVFGILGFMILLAVAGYDLTQLAEKESSLPLIGAVLIAIVGFIGVLLSNFDVQSMLGGVSNPVDEILMPILVMIFLIIIVGATAGGGE